MGSCGIMLRPSKIRFSQCSISNTFTDGTLIGELVDDIYAGRCFASAVKPIEVSKIREKWYTSDNRRLWVFRQLELLGKLKEIRVKVIEAILPGKMSNRYGGKSITIRNGGDPGGITHRMVPQVTVKQTKTRRSKKAGKSTQQFTSDITISTDSNCKKTNQPDSKTKQANDTGSSACKFTQPKTLKVGGGSGSKPSNGGTSMKPETIKVGGRSGNKPSNGTTSMKPKIAKVAGESGSKPSYGITSMKPKTVKVDGGSGSKPSNGCTSMEPKIVKVGGGSGSKPSTGCTSMKPKAAKVAGGSGSKPSNGTTSMKPKAVQVGGGSGSKPSNRSASMKPKAVQVGGGSGSKPSNGSTSMKPKTVKVGGESRSNPLNGCTSMKPKAVKLCVEGGDAYNDMDTNVCESVYKSGSKKKRRKRTRRSKKKMLDEFSENAKERKRAQCQHSEEMHLEAEPLEDMFTMDDHNVKDKCVDNVPSDVRLAYELTRLTYQSTSRNLVHTNFSATNWFDLMVDAENKQNDVRYIESNHNLETMSNGYWHYKHIAELFLNGSLCAHHLLFANLDDSSI
ncbi:uncharacterized protein LOC128213255 [Mya arenaria]|uniref:uncharacterized protein LOC128213255 n=1 Tax=Mya arenaria TaxID=6604 RepID=UPI0022E90E30|nr:uncharacterized protein LOC128213255 [Mya arenaria]